MRCLRCDNGLERNGTVELSNIRKKFIKKVYCSSSSGSGGGFSSSSSGGGGSSDSGSGGGHGF